MAAREKDVYSEFSGDFEDVTEGRCEKMSDRHIAGRPDLYTSCEEYGSVWIEVKFETAPKRESTKIPVKMTGPQREWIREEQRCGGNAGWMLCVKFGPREWRYWAGTDPDVQSVDQADYLAVRKAGEDTPVHEIMGAITRNR